MTILSLPAWLLCTLVLIFFLFLCLAAKVLAGLAIFFVVFGLGGKG